MFRKTVVKAVRLAQLLVTVWAASATESLKRRAKALEIRLDGLNTGLEIKPLTEVPFPDLDLESLANPVVAILESPEFKKTSRFFYDNPVAARSLISANAQALLYAVVRNLKPHHVFEIGTYKAGTTEAICRALCANGHGILHTVDPFQAEYVSAVLKHWPSKLIDHVRLYPMDSMAFYKEKEREGVHPDLVFVDGNHDYEFALFDIARGGRYLTRGGFIFVDNVAQAGPFFAALDFLAANSGWQNLKVSNRPYDLTKSFDRERTTIPDTDFIVLRAPKTYSVDARPKNFGRTRWWSETLSGIALKFAPNNVSGVLNVQVVFRGFGIQPAEVVEGTTIELKEGATEISVQLPIKLAGRQFIYRTVEPWLIWQGSQALELLEPPTPF